MDFKRLQWQSSITCQPKSKVLLINFTGIGCGACQAAVPFLKELKGKFSNEDFDLIAIEGWSRKEHSIQVYANNKNSITPF